MSHDLSGDVRAAIRVLLRTPATSAIIVLTLAAAIAAATIGFSFADLALFRGIPVDDGSRVVSVFFSDASGSNPRARVSAPDYVDLRARLTSLERVAVFRQGSAPLIVNGQSTTIAVSYATADLFHAMGQVAVAGRVFDRGDDERGAPRVAMLSYRYWQDVFGGRPTALGTELQIGRDLYTIVGVATRDMEFGNLAEIDVWLPMYVTGDEPRDARTLRLVARLRDGVSFERAAAEVATVGDGLASEHPETNAGWRVRLIPIRDVTGGPSLWVIIALFLLSIGLLMAIATANVSNLVMVRTLARERELAVRTALGASRTRLVRQLIVEGVVLSAGAAFLAVALTFLGLRGITAISPEPVFQQLRIDEHELAFVGALVLLCPLLFSLLPARSLARADMRQALASGGRSVTSSTRGRGVLVVAQLALAVILLIAAGLAVRSVTAIYARPTGLEADRLLIFTLDFNEVIYPSTTAAHAAATSILDAFQRVSGVASVAMVDALPILGAESVAGVGVERQPLRPNETRPTVLATAATEQAAAALGLKSLAGTWWRATDSGVAVVGRETAVRFLGGIDAAVGQWLTLFKGGNELRVRVVGVVNDVATGDALDWTRPRVWMPMSDSARRVTFVVRTVGDPSRLSDEVRRLVAAAAPAVPIEGLGTMTDALARAASSDYVIMDMLAGFALLALVLAAAGIFGVVSFSAAQRTAEFGTRIALGASTVDVIRLVARQALVFLAIGLALGLAGGIVVGFAMKSALYDLSPLDPITIGGVSALLILVTLLATAMPAWRAGRIDPIAALRSQ